MATNLNTRVEKLEQVQAKIPPKARVWADTFGGTGADYLTPDGRVMCLEDLVAEPIEPETAGENRTDPEGEGHADV